MASPVIGDENILKLIKTAIKTVIISAIAVLMLMSLAGVMITTDYNVTLKQFIVAFSCLPFGLLLGYEIFDTFYAKTKIKQFYETGLAGRILSTVFVWLLILVVTMILVMMYLPASPATPFVAFVVGFYVMMPETSDDFILFAIWCACSVSALLYGWIPAETWWSYQILFADSLSDMFGKIKPQLPNLGV